MVEDCTLHIFMLEWDWLPLTLLNGHGVSTVSPYGKLGARIRNAIDDIDEKAAPFRGSALDRMKSSRIELR